MDITRREFDEQLFMYNQMDKEAWSYCVIRAFFHDDDVLAGSRGIAATGLQARQRFCA